jgi:hypothetical protein
VIGYRSGGATDDLSEWSRRKGYRFVDVSDPATLRYLIYKDL